MAHPSIRREVKCEECGKKFSKARSKAVRQEKHFCNRNCFNSWHTGKNNHQFNSAKTKISCDNCGEKFERYQSQISESNFCSRDCYHEFSKKDSFDGRNFYSSSQWESKRKEIRDRDGNMCVWCGESEKELHVHHLKPMSMGGKKLDNKNLVTLCQQCHTIAHKAIS